jgi:hypothetical protein
MVYEHCLEERNATLINIFGSPGKIPNNLPISGALLNYTNANGSLANLFMPDLPECDLQKELDNVSILEIHMLRYDILLLLIIIL